MVEAMEKGKAMVDQKEKENTKESRKEKFRPWSYGKGNYGKGKKQGQGQRKLLVLQKNRRPGCIRQHPFRHADGEEQGELLWQTRDLCDPQLFVVRGVVVGTEVTC